MKKALASLLALVGIHQHLSAEQKQDVVAAAYHSAPGAVAAGSARIGGLPLSDWLVLASLAFIALQAAYLIWKWRRDARREDERIRAGRPAPASDLAPLGADE